MSTEPAVTPGYVRPWLRQTVVTSAVEVEVARGVLLKPEPVVLWSVLQELGRLLEQVVLVGFAFLRVAVGFRILFVEAAWDIELVRRLRLAVACRRLVVMRQTPARLNRAARARQGRPFQDP